MFPYEKLYYSSKDKSEIDAMPEIKREEILADRAAQFERHQQDLALRRLLASREKEEAKAAEKKKRKASAADLDESQRKSSRQRTTLGGRKSGERNDAIEAYKKSRAEKGIRDEQRQREISDRKDRNGIQLPNDDLSDTDAAGDSDTDWQRSRDRIASPSPPKDDPMAELVDIQRVKIGRDNFAQVCYNPGFEEAITNCYARICIGPSARNPGQNDYRLARIKGFSTGKPYAITAANGRPMPVETYVVAAHGKAEKSWTFLECSMSRFTEDEWRRYRITMANEDLKLPTKSFVNKKLEQINKLINHRFTDADITAKINRQQALIAKINREDERRPVEEARQAALTRGDDEAARRYEGELRDIVPMKLALGTSLVKEEKSYTNKEQERLAELNRRNQRINSENVRRAQVAEMRVKKRLGQRVKGVDDLFADGSDISRSGTPVSNLGTSAGHITSRIGTSPAPSASALGRSPSRDRVIKSEEGLPGSTRSLGAQEPSQLSSSSNLRPEDALPSRDYHHHHRAATPDSRAISPINGHSEHGQDQDVTSTTTTTTTTTANNRHGGTTNGNVNINGVSPHIITDAPETDDQSGIKDSVKKGLPVIKKALREEEMMKQKVMDLDIDIEI